MSEKDTMSTKSSPSSRRGTLSKRASTFYQRLSKFRNKNPKTDFNSMVSPSLFQLKRLSDFIVTPKEQRAPSSIFTEADTSFSVYGKRNKRNPYMSFERRKSSAFDVNKTPDKRLSSRPQDDEKVKDQQMVVDWLMQKCNDDENQADASVPNSSKARRDSGLSLKSKSDSNLKKMVRRLSLSPKTLETCSVCEKRFDPQDMNKIESTPSNKSGFVDYEPSKYICDSCYNIWHPMEVKSLKSNFNRSLSTIEGSLDDDDTEQQTYDAKKTPRHSMDSVITTNVTRFSTQPAITRSENNLNHVRPQMTKSILSQNSLTDQNNMNNLEMRASGLESNLSESMLSVSRQSSLLRAPSIGIYKFNRTSLLPQSKLKRSRKKSIYYN